MDKLPALSGLAQVFMGHLKDKYVAGLWSKDLLRGVLWEGAYNKTASTTTYRAPTWSWASIDGVVTYPGFLIEDPALPWKPLAQILRVETVPVTEDVTGQLTGGYLLISGPLRKVAVEGNDYLGRSLRRFSFRLEGPPEGAIPDKLSYTVPLRLTPAPEKNDLVIFPSTRNITMPDFIFLMPLICVFGAEPDHCTTRGLVLLPIEAPGSYEKIGTFKIYKQTTTKSLFFSTHSIPDHNYEEFDGENRYTIRIL
jgi:hypothetical protein